MTIPMLRQFKTKTKELIELKRWIPSERRIVLDAEHRKPHYIAWSLSSFVEYKSNHVELATNRFVQQWNAWLNKTNASLQRRDWHTRDTEELKGIDWNDVSVNRRFRLVCEQAVHMDVGEFQDWAKSYLSGLINVMNAACQPALSLSVQENEGIVFRNDATSEVVDKGEALKMIGERLEGKEGCQMIPIHVSFFSKNFLEGHMVALFLDTRVKTRSRQKTALLYDPNGEEFDVWSSIIGMESFEDLFVELNEMFESIGFRIVQSRNMCMNRGQNVSRKCVKMLSNGGYCMWYSYFVMMMSMISQSFPAEIIETVESMESSHREIVLETFIGWLITKYNRTESSWLRQRFLRNKRKASQSIRRYLRDPVRQQRKRNVFLAHQK